MVHFRDLQGKSFQGLLGCPLGLVLVQTPACCARSARTVHKWWRHSLSEALSALPTSYPTFPLTFTLQAFAVLPHALTQGPIFPLTYWLYHTMPLLGNNQATQMIPGSNFRHAIFFGWCFVAGA